MRKIRKLFKNSILGKILKVIWKIIKLLIELFIVFIALVIITQKVTNNEHSFLGFRIFNVATGSMEPQYMVGDILISKERDPKEIKVGDNIVYMGTVGEYNGRIITHKVIDITYDENGDCLYHTKGIANTVEDPVVTEKQLFGEVVHSNIVLAWICKIVTNRYGLYFFIMIPIIIYAFTEFLKIQGEKVEQERKDKEEESEKEENDKTEDKKQENTEETAGEEKPDEENPEEGKSE